VADGIELLGEYEDSGFKQAPYLARRDDGQMIQLTELLYLVTDEADGCRGPAEIAERVSRRYGRTVSGENVRYLIEEKLRPLGILAAADGSSPQVARPEPLLGLTVRGRLLPEQLVNALGRAFSPLFYPAAIAVVLGGLLALDGWLFFVHGIAQPTRELVYQPLLLLMVWGLLAAGALFHEIGHAAAARYGGARPGAIGAGLYLIWPVFYTDVTDAYRLPRRGRLRTDLGGVYFNLLFALGTSGAYFATGFEPLLVLVLLQHVQTLVQFLPFLRLDGYYVVSDLSGVPDMFARIRPTLRSLLPWSARDDRVEELKPWARVAVTGYVLTLIPLLLFAAALLVVNAPRVFATAWDSFFVQLDDVSRSLDSGQTASSVAGMTQMAALLLPALGIAATGGRLGTRLVSRLWGWSENSLPRRALMLVGSAAAVGFLVFSWWPGGQYKPIQPGETGTIQGGVAQLASYETGRAALTAEREDELGGATFVSDGLSREPEPAEEAEEPGSEPGNVVFERTGDSNLAVALAREDATSVFALAFAVTELSHGALEQSNQAVASASCERCRAIAIAIQIVLVLNDPAIIAPENSAVAVNYACTLCETLALAYQIIFGIGEPVAFTEEGLARLAEIKGELEELGDSGLSLEEIQASVDELVEEIHYILETELVPLEEASSDGPDTEPETETTRTTETATTESTTTGTTTTTETTTETTTAETTEAP
jgi:putative peptide zinc metalloprotease protein